jgi:hypothetical protein
VATVSVPGMSSQTIALPVLTGDPGLRNSFIVQSDAAPGTLFASAAAVGAPGFGLVEQIGKDQQTTANGGGHPWDLTSGQGAVLLLFNHSTVPKYFNVKIGNGGVLWQQPYQLAPMETRAINIRDLIAGQVKDQDGKVLSQTLEQGEIGWFNPNPAEGKGRLMQIGPASQTVAGNTRVARNFSCGYYYNLCGAYLATDSITLNYGEASSPGSLGEVIPMICTNGDDGGCSGQSSSHSGLGYTYSWVSNTPSIATVYGSSTSSSATFWGNGGGVGSAIGYISSESCSFGGGGTPTVCQLSYTKPLQFNVVCGGATSTQVIFNFGVTPAYPACILGASPTCSVSVESGAVEVAISPATSCTTPGGLAGNTNLFAGPPYSSGSIPGYVNVSASTTLNAKPVTATSPNVPVVCTSP